MMAQSGGANASNNNKKLERIKQTIGISVCERADERMKAEREREGVWRKLNIVKRTANTQSEQ